MQSKWISTTEKEVQLEAEGIPWPICACCGLEKAWRGNTWYCRARLRESKKKQQHRLLRTPGTYEYNRKLNDIIVNMQKYIEGTPENIEYKEKVKARWLTKLNEHS